ncbi:MAG: DUF3382 domain-containing protein, partial [Plesiomonas shigelloides]
MKRTFMHALLSAGMLVVLTFMLMGLRLTNEGGQVIVSGAEPAQVRWIFLGAALVFVVQLLRPWLSGYW